MAPSICSSKESTLIHPAYSPVAASTAGAASTSAAARSRRALGGGDESQNLGRAEEPRRYRTCPTVARVGIVRTPRGLRRRARRRPGGPSAVHPNAPDPTAVAPSPKSSADEVSPSPDSRLNLSVYRASVQPDRKYRASMSSPDGIGSFASTAGTRSSGGKRGEASPSMIAGW